LLAALCVHTVQKPNIKTGGFFYHLQLQFSAPWLAKYGCTYIVYLPKLFQFCNLSAAKQRHETEKFLSVQQRKKSSTYLQTIQLTVDTTNKAEKSGDRWDKDNRN
jgi:hypothetical protein